MEIELQVILLIILAAFLVAYLKYMRGPFFARRPKFKHSFNDTDIYAPVDGTVVYIRQVNGTKIEHEKLGEKVVYNLDDHIVSDKYILVGIYMCVFDCHWMIASKSSNIIKVKHLQTNANLPMMDLLEYIKFSFTGRISNWFSRKIFGFILQNERMHFVFEDYVETGIADKYVNKIECHIQDWEHINGIDEYGSLIKAGTIIGRIKRGSQVDLIFKADDISLDLKEGQKIRVGQKIGVVNENK